MHLYHDYPQMPYVNPQRDLATEVFKPVPRRNMVPLADDLLAGDIILLWRVAFGTFTNETVFPKYFEYTYGINAPERLTRLIEKGYVEEETAFDSLDHITAGLKKQILKTRDVKGLSQLKSAELNDVLKAQLTEAELGSHFTVRGLALTDRGRETLTKYQEVVDRHPKKKF